MALGAPGKTRVKRVDRWLRPIRRFMEIEASSGLVLLAATCVAVGLANSSWSGAYQAFLHTEVFLKLGTWSLKGDLGHLVINDGFMTIFFFVVGLEIKREMVQGELRGLRNALLPIIAAIGGMVMPAFVYAWLQWGQPGQNGWAIPMATDIAFVVGILTLYGDRVPIGFKVFLLSLAIVDDLASIVVIATLFSQSLSLPWLMIACIGCMLIYGLNKSGVRSIAVYTVAGLLLWLCVFNSGVHPTLAGVALGLLTPAYAWFDRSHLLGVVESIHSDRNTNQPIEVDSDQIHALREATIESVSPLERIETTLHPWVAFAIMPLFAFANAGVALQLGSMSHPVAIAVASGLFLGKTVGITAFVFLAVRLGVTRLPDGVSWWMLASGACLAGIGFTMSLFINTLSFPNETALMDAGKIGIFMGSILSGLVGVGMLSFALRRTAGSLA